MERQRLEALLKEDRLTVIKILVMNGYTARIITVKEDGKKKTYIEYWEEKQL